MADLDVVIFNLGIQSFVACGGQAHGVGSGVSVSVRGFLFIADCAIAEIPFLKGDTSGL